MKTATEVEAMQRAAQAALDERCRRLQRIMYRQAAEIFLRGFEVADVTITDSLSPEDKLTVVRRGSAHVRLVGKQVNGPILTGVSRIDLNASAVRELMGILAEHLRSITGKSVYVSDESIEKLKEENAQLKKALLNPMPTFDRGAIFVNRNLVLDDAVAGENERLKDENARLKSDIKELTALHAKQKATILKVGDVIHGRL